MSLGLKLDKKVSAAPDAPRTQPSRLGLGAHRHALRDRPITQDCFDTLQVFEELSRCVLLEWARIEKTRHDMDFADLARHLQQKAGHVWPKQTLGAAPIPANWRTFKVKLEKYLGGFQRTNIATHRLRAVAILTQELAWMPCLMPPYRLRAGHAAEGGADDVEVPERPTQRE